MFVLFDKHMKGIVGHPEALKVSQSKKRPIAVKQPSENVSEVTVSSIGEMEDVNQPEDADLIMVDLKYFKLDCYNILNNLEIYLPSRPYDHYVHTKHVPISSSLSAGFKKKCASLLGADRTFQVELSAGKERKIKRE